jgi:hypothetical protein
VYELADRDATFKLTAALVNRELSCFNGAVRVYWPGFTLDADRAAHKLYFGPDIEDMQAWGRPLGRQLFKLLVGAAGFRFADAPLVRMAREAVAKQRQQEAQDRVANLAVGADEQRQILGELEKAWDENAALQRRLNELSAELADQKRAWNDVWKANHTDGDESAAPAEIPINRPLDAVNKVAAEFADVLEFMETATRSAVDSPYRDPDRVYALLRSLGELARDWKAGKLGRGWYHALKEKGYEYKDDISMTSAGKFGDEYTFVYQGRKVLFQNHVTLGASHNPQECLSVHWYRDEARKVIAVGWVGKHKTNTRT